MIGLFDAHCHIAPPGTIPAQSEKRVALAGRLLCGVGPEDWRAIENAAAGWNGTTAAYGLHPWYANGVDASWPEHLEERLVSDPAAWLGEAGLDALKTDRAPAERQEEVLRIQLRLAARLDRPVNLHCVKAWDSLIALLDGEYLAADGPRPFIVHSFAGPHQMVPVLAERGAYFTVGPLFSRRDSRRHRQRAALLPDARLLLESDAFLLPGVDAAEDIEHALAWLAEARGMTANGAAALVAANSRRLFNHV